MRSAVRSCRSHLAAWQSKRSSFTYISASAEFFQADGSTVDLLIQRYNDPTTKLITTFLIFAWCPYGNGGTVFDGRQEGAGPIPNAALQGTVTPNMRQPDTISLLVDTNAVAGFSNFICFGTMTGFGFDPCGIQVPTSGTLVSLSWTRTLDSASNFGQTEKFYKLGRFISSVNDVSWNFSAHVAGNGLLGSSIQRDAGSSMYTTTSTDSQRIKDSAAKGRFR